MEENKDYNPSQYEDDDRMEAPKSAKSIRGYQTIIVILAVILAALSILYFNIHRQQQEEYDLLLVDRDSIKSNLSHLMEDFDNLQISNDSISQSLGLERSRADSLMERLTKEALKVSAFPAFGKRTALELVMASAHEGRTARLAAPAPEAKILDLQRANEEPLLRAAGDNTPDLDRMTRNARKRNGGNDDE